MRMHAFTPSDGPIVLLVLVFSVWGCIPLEVLLN